MSEVSVPSPASVQCTNVSAHCVSGAVLGAGAQSGTDRCRADTGREVSLPSDTRGTLRARGQRAGPPSEALGEVPRSQGSQPEA